MMSASAYYLYGAKLCRFTANVIDHWPAVLLLVCILSPISPHIRIPQGISHRPCEYIGTRGIVSNNPKTCGFIEIIDTRERARRWSLQW
ncbi:hypothetical protein [Parasphingorhabdus sp.]|uniref:hypothetical protein n=1 Tax=Parasphingorhabdus sp. TaxID=2709688 RepID=UPI003D2E6494